MTSDDAPYACVTIDLDTLRCYRNIHGLDRTMVGQEGDPTYTAGVRRALDLFDEMGIRGTLFVVGRDTVVPAHRHLLEEADGAGHELGNHTYTHHYDLPDRPSSEKRSELARGEGAIASITGRKPTGFRAPGYNVDADIVRLCRSRDYLYDSSILGSPPYYLAKYAVMLWKEMTGEPSRSARTPASNLLAPLTPYYPDEDQIWKRRGAEPSRPGRRAPLLEVPMCAVPGLRLPVIGTTLHLFGPRGFDALYPTLRARFRSILNLEFHAIDFIDETDLAERDRQLVDHQPDLAIPWAEKRRRYVDVFHKIREDYVFAPMETAVRAHEP